MPRINSLAGGYYSYYKNMGPYIFNRRLLIQNNKQFCIDVKGYSNTFCIDGPYNQAIVSNYDYAIINYDCPFMTLNQYLTKHNKWYMAHLKQFGSLERFGLTEEEVHDKEKLLKFCNNRLFVRRTDTFKKMPSTLHPEIIRNRILNMTSENFGKYNFTTPEQYKQLIKMYGDISDNKKSRA